MRVKYVTALVGLERKLEWGPESLDLDKGLAVAKVLVGHYRDSPKAGSGERFERSLQVLEAVYALRVARGVGVLVP